MFWKYKRFGSENFGEFVLGDLEMSSRYYFMYYILKTTNRFALNMYKDVFCYYSKGCKSCFIKIGPLELELFINLLAVFKKG